MSLFDEANQDAKFRSASEASLGPRLGFAENFDVAYDAEAKAASQYSVERAMYDGFNEQRESLRKLGVEGVDIGVLTNGLDIMNYYNGAGAEPDTMDIVKGRVQSNRLAAYDDRIADLKKKYPSVNLRTTREMSDWVKQQAVEAEQKAANSRTTVLGDVGGFFGATAAGLDPRYNPLNTLTLGVGGAGKTVLSRIATQAGAQGAIETVNQVTGVQAERKALGLPYGVEDALTRIGGAAAGGAAAQGIGEALALGAKRWFANSTKDPAPPPPPDTPSSMDAQAPSARPDFWTSHTEEIYRKAYTEAYGTGHTADLRGHVDLEHVTARMERWDGENPVDIRPPEVDAATKFPRSYDEAFTPVNAETRAAMGKDTLEEMARRADPKVFDVVDKIKARQSELRAQLDTVRPTEAQANAAVQDMTDRINDLEQKVKYKRFTAEERAAAGGRSEVKAKAQDEIKMLTARRDAEIQRLTTQDSPEATSIRAAIQKADESLRDLAPMVSRAYDRARGEWSARQEYADMVRNNITKRNSNGSYAPDADAAKMGTYEEAVAYMPQRETLSDKAPILQRATADMKLKDGADAADVARAIAANDAEVFDASLFKFREGLESLLADEKMGTMTTASGDKINLDEKMFVPVDGGQGVQEMTVRDFLKKQLDDEQDLKAVQTCSL